MHIHLALLLCSLFPPLHIHVVCVSITAWNHIFISSVRQDFLSLYFSPFFFLFTLPQSQSSHLSMVSVNFILCPIMSHSFMLKNNLCLFCLLDSDSWPCINLLLVTSVSPCLFLSLSPALHRTFYFDLPPSPLGWLFLPNLPHICPSLAPSPPHPPLLHL